MGGRFLNKRFTVQDGFSKGQGDDSPAMFFDGDTGVVTRPLNIEGLMTSTMAITGSLTTGPMAVKGTLIGTALTINTVTAGSGTITNLLTGAVTGTAVVVNTVTAGSANFDNVRLGSSAGNGLITAAWKTVYTWNMGAIAGVVGSTNSVIAVDVAASGAAIGDTVIATAVGSIDTFVQYQAAIYSAAAINLRAWYTGSVGALTPGNVPFKITVIKI